MSVQDFVLLFCVWCESRELGGRGSSGFSSATPMVETLPSDRVTLRIPSNRASQQKQLNPYHLLLGHSVTVTGILVRFPMSQTLLFSP